MVMLDLLRRIFDPVGYAKDNNIIVRQAFEIDKLRMQCIERDLYYELFAIANEELFQTVRRYKLWEPNDVY